MRSKLPTLVAFAALLPAALAAPATAIGDDPMRPGDLIFNSGPEINALDHCADLPEKVLGDINSLSQIDSLCRYYSETSCGGAVTFTHNSREHHLMDTELEVISAGARSVYCIDASEVEHVSVLTAPSSSGSSASKPGDILFVPRIQFVSAYRTNAFNDCRNLPAGVAGFFQSLMQCEGAFCRYYGSKDCKGTALLDFDSTEWRLRMGTSNKLVAGTFSVECWPKVSSIGINSPRSAPFTIPESETATEVMPRNEAPLARPGDLVLYKENDFKGPAATINAMNACTRIPDSHWAKVHSLVQHQGAVCQYYRTADCTRETSFGPKEVTRYSWQTLYLRELNDGYYQMIRVFCRPLSSSKAAAKRDDEPTPPARNETSPRPPYRGQRGPSEMVNGKESPDHVGDASPNKIVFTVRRTPTPGYVAINFGTDVWYIPANAVPFFGLDVHISTGTINDGNNKTNPIDQSLSTSRCSKSDAARTDATCPGDVMFCRDRSYSDKCTWENAWNKCTNLLDASGGEKAVVHKSLVQFKGAECHYYNQQDCAGNAYSLPSVSEHMALGEVILGMLNVRSFACHGLPVME